MMTLWNAFDDKFFDDFWRRGQLATRPVFEPAVDVVEHDSGYALRAELPGMKPEEIDISVDGNVLTLKGERRFEDKSEKGGYQRIERRYGTFQRSFNLPDTVNADAIEATMENGVLALYLPKQEQVKPRKVKVGSTLTDKAKNLFTKVRTDTPIAAE